MTHMIADLMKDIEALRLRLGRPVFDVLRPHVADLRY